MLQQGLEGVRRRVRGRARRRPRRRRPRARRRRSSWRTSRTPASSASPCSAPTARSCSWSRSPQDPPSDLALVGVYLFDPHDPRARCARSSRRRAASSRSPTPSSGSIDHGHRVRHEMLARAGGSTPARRTRCSRATGSCSRRIEPRIDGNVDDDSRVEGRVVIEAGAEIVELDGARARRSSARGTRVVDSYIGPFTSVGGRLRDRRLRDRALGRARAQPRSSASPASPTRSSAATSRSCARRATPMATRLMRRRPLPGRARPEGAPHGRRSPNPTSSPASYVVDPTIHGDERGLFIETYRREWFPQRARDDPGQPRRPPGRARSSGLHYHLHQADYWYVPFGHAPGSCCTTCARARPPTAPR